MFAILLDRKSFSSYPCSFPPDVVTNQREIAIQKSSLTPAVYKLKLEAQMQGSNYTGSDEAFLEITAEPIKVIIAGGTARLLQWEKDIFLDASATHDPNILHGDNEDLMYWWFCKVKPNTVHFVIGKGGCFGHGEGVIEHRNDTWTIPAKTLIKNGVYNMTLKVKSNTVKGREGRYEQHLEVRSGSVIKTDIK